MYTTEPNGTSNSTPGGNTQNAIGGRTKYALLADGKTIKTDASGNPVKTTGGFGNQFSIPSANEKPSGDTVHYYRKTCLLYTSMPRPIVPRFSGKWDKRQNLSLWTSSLEIISSI